MFTFETSDQKEVRRFRIAQFNGRTATARAAGSAVTGHVRSIVENKASVPAIDSGGSVGNHDNLWENLSATLTWRAAGFAVYGGYSNTFRNLYIADMLCYSGITISSLDFGYSFVGFGTQPTVIQNVSLVRDGGHFWGQQAFGAIWAFSASKEFRGIRVSDVDIVDPTYSGIMFQTKYNGAAEHPFTDTVFTNISISGKKSQFR